jgi:putative ABC transport system substrate-binding protein
MQFDRLRRREFMTLIGGAAATWPLVARGQEPGRIYRLGALFSSPRDAPHSAALFDELRRLGFIEGRNLVIDAAGYSLPPERMGAHAADLMSGPVDVFLAAGDAAVRAAQQATTSIPILAFTDDMVGQGFVSSLSKPGGNITGVTILSSELDGKRQEILIEAVPGIRRIAALVDSNTTTPSQLHMLEDGARARGVELSIHRVAWREEIGSAIDAAKAAGAGAVNVLASSLLFNSRAFIFHRLAALRLPAVYQFPGNGGAGWAHRLRSSARSAVPRYRESTARQAAARQQARRSAGRATDEIRASDQS